MPLELTIDVLLGAALMFLAWRVLSARDLFASAVLFVAFGLIMALAWTRLRAPDIALAEAAIGAGLTGALVIDAIGQLEPRARRRRARRRSEERDAGG